jgi:tRNA-modifying protein YgfZ
LKPLQMSEIDGVCLRRRDLLAMPGFDVITASDRTIPFENLSVGDEETFETLRIEAAAPEFGKDIDESRFVMEVRGADRAVSYSKGCFPGQEPIVMARDRAGFINRAFLSLKGRQVIPSGTKLTRDGLEVGVVTSSCHSPRLNQPIAIGYIKRGHQDVGTELDANGITLEIYNRI